MDFTLTIEGTGNSDTIFDLTNQFLTTLESNGAILGRATFTCGDLLGGTREVRELRTPENPMNLAGT